MQLPHFTVKSRLSLRLVAAAAMALSVSQAPAQQNKFIQETTSLPIARAFHGTAVLGDFLYVFGGSIYTPPPRETETPAAIVNVARIGPTGHVSQFINTTPLPNARHYINNSTIVLNDTVYVLGGSSEIENGERATTVIWSRPMPNGMLIPWKESAPFPAAGVSCLAAFATPGYLHITGGLTGKEVSDRVWSVRVLPDASIGEWEEAPPLPARLWFHCGAVVGARAYVWGGMHETGAENIASQSIYSAPVLATGKLGTWREETQKLPVAFYSASSAVAGPYLFSISPRYTGGVKSNDTWWTFATPEGMSPWQKQATDVKVRVYHAASTDYRHGVIYLNGGKWNTGDADHPLQNSYMLRLSPGARQAAEQSWQRALVAHADAISTLEMAEGAAGQAPQFSFDAPAAAQEKSAQGFHPLETARQLSSSQRRPLVMYFKSEKAKPCIAQNELLANQDLAKLFNNAVLASVDVQQNPQIAQSYGVFQVPTWIFYNQRDEETARGIGVQQLADLGNKVPKQ